MEIVDSIGVRLLPEMRGFKAEVEREVKKLDTKVTIDVNVGKVDTVKARAQLMDFRAAMKAKEIELRAELKVDTKGADRALDRLKTATKAATSSGGDADRMNLRLVTSFLSLGGSVGATTLKFGAMAGAVAPMLTLLSSVQLAVAQLVPALALLPGVLVAGGTAMATLKLGLSGFSDALKSMDDPEKFAEALEKLSPAARAAAIAVKDLRTPFKELQQLVQERLFVGLSDDIRETGSVILTALRPGLVAISGEFNKIALGILEMGRSADSISFINTALKSTKGVMANVGEATVPVLEGFREIARVGLSMLPGLTSGFGDLATSFRDWATNLAASGDLERMITSALAAMKDLGATIRNVFGIITQILQAATGAGDGLFATMREVTGEILDFLKSAEGKTALTSLFNALKTVTAGLEPVIKAIGSALTMFVIPALEALAPAIAAGLGALAPAMAPLGAALAALGPVIGAIAQQVAGLLVVALQALSPIVVALAPVIQQLANLLGQTLSGIVVAITPILVTLANILAQVLGAALTVLQPLLPVIVDAIGEMARIISGTLAAALPTLVEVATVMGGAMVTAIQTIAPLLPEIVLAWSNVFNALVPLLPVLAQLAAQLLPQVIAILPQLLPLLVSLAAMWVDILTTMMPLIQAVVGFLIPAIGAILNVVSSVVSSVVPIFQGFFDFFAGTIGFFVKLITGDFAGAWESAKQAVGGAFKVIEGIVKTVGNILLAPIRIAIDTVTGIFRNAGGNFGEAIRSAVNAIPAALGNLGNLLLEAGKSIIRGLIDGIGQMAGNAVQKVKDLVGKVRDFFPFSPAKVGPFSGKGYTLYSGRALAEDFATGIRERTFLAAKATAGLMDAATLDPALTSNAMGALDGAVERSFSFRAESMAGEVATAVREGLAEAEFSIDQKGILKVTQKADLRFNRR